MFNRPRCRLHVLKGDAPNRDIPVPHSPFMIGGDRACDWVLSDPSVRPQHAVLEREGEGPWTLRNLGQRGVLVNEQSVTSILLRDGDTIQIGATTLFIFHAPEVASKNPATAGSAAPTVNPVLLAVFGVVVLLSVAFLVLAPKPSSSNVDPDTLTPTLMAEVLKGTRDCLLGNEVLKDYPTPMPRFEASSEPAGRLYILIALRQRGADTAQVADWVDQQLLDLARQQLTQAWLLEAQGRLAEAHQVYRRLAEALPALRCPVTRYAAFRQAVLADQIAAQRPRD